MKGYESLKNKLQVQENEIASIAEISKYKLNTKDIEIKPKVIVSK